MAIGEAARRTASFASRDRKARRSSQKRVTGRRGGQCRRTPGNLDYRHVGPVGPLKGRRFQLNHILKQVSRSEGRGSS